MPEVSRFYGIQICLYYRDHPPAHFHAYYGEHEALVSIATGTIIDGYLPRTAELLVKRWRKAHLSELRENWTRARNYQPLVPIAPLS